MNEYLLWCEYACVYVMGACMCVCVCVFVCIVLLIYSPKCTSTHFKDWNSRNYEDNPFLYKIIVRTFLVNIAAYFSRFPSTVSICYVIYKTTWYIHRLYAYWEGLADFCFVTVKWAVYIISIETHVISCKTNQMQTTKMRSCKSKLHLQIVLWYRCQAGH